jgi:hypothetical protein
LADHWLRRCGAAHRAAPPEVGRAPGSPAGVPDSMPEHDGLQTQRSRFESTDGGFTRAGAVADRFIVHPGHIDGGQITRAPQAGQVYGVTAVGCDPVPSRFREQRRRHHPAHMAVSGQGAREPVATRTGFIDKDEGYGRGWHLAEQLLDSTLSGTEGAAIGHLSAVRLRHVSHSNRIFVDSQTDIQRARLWPG